MYFKIEKKNPWIILLADVYPRNLLLDTLDQEVMCFSQHNYFTQYRPLSLERLSLKLYDPTKKTVFGRNRLLELKNTTLIILLNRMCELKYWLTCKINWFSNVCRGGAQNYYHPLVNFWTTQEQSNTIWHIRVILSTFLKYLGVCPPPPATHTNRAFLGLRRER